MTSCKSNSWFMFACLRKGPKTIFKANILYMSKKKQIIISFLFSLYLVIVLINPKWAAISIMQTERKIRGVSVWTPAKDFYTSTEVIKMCFSKKPMAHEHNYIRKSCRSLLLWEGIDKRTFSEKILFMSNGVYQI